MTLGRRFLLEAVAEEQEHHLHAGPERGHPESGRAGGAHPGPPHGAERGQQGEARGYRAQSSLLWLLLGADGRFAPQYPYETLFRSQHYALLDNGCREFLFLSDFFMVAGNSALDLFNSIMGKTLSMFLVRTSCAERAARGDALSVNLYLFVRVPSAEEHVHVRVRLLRQHRRLPVHPHHPALQSPDGQEEHPSAQQVSPAAAARDTDSDSDSQTQTHRLRLTDTDSQTQTHRLRLRVNVKFILSVTMKILMHI